MSYVDVIRLLALRTFLRMFLGLSQSTALNLALLLAFSVRDKSYWAIVPVLCVCVCVCVCETRDGRYFIIIMIFIITRSSTIRFITILSSSNTITIKA